MNKRWKERVENVDFEKLRECLKNHGIKQKELSIVCGYYPDYIKKNTLRKHYLNKHVSDVLTYAYKVDPSEYIDTAETTISDNNTMETTASNDDSYKCTISCNGEFFKKLAFASINKHISIEDFIFDCILEGLKQEEN